MAGCDTLVTIIPDFQKSCTCISLEVAHRDPSSSLGVGLTRLFYHQGEPGSVIALINFQEVLARVGNELDVVFPRQGAPGERFGPGVAG